MKKKTKPLLELVAKKLPQLKAVSQEQTKGGHYAYTWQIGDKRFTTHHPASGSDHRGLKNALSFIRRRMTDLTNGGQL